MEYVDQHSLKEEVIRIRHKLELEEKGDVLLLNKCRKIETILVVKELTAKQLIKYQYKIITLKFKVNELEEKRWSKMKKTWVILLFLYALNTCLLLYLKHMEQPPGIIELISMLSFMTIAVLGTMTSHLLEEFKKKRTVVDQMLLAIIIPIIFINIFVFKEDEIEGVAVLNLVMFACGFSVEFLLLLLNKLIDSAKNTFNVGKEAEVTNDEIYNKILSLESKHQKADVVNPIVKQDLDGTDT